MTEDSERQFRRKVLEKERDKLTQAQEWLAAIHKTKDEDEEMGGSSEETMDDTMRDWDGGFA